MAHCSESVVLGRLAMFGRAEGVGVERNEGGLGQYCLFGKEEDTVVREIKRD